MKEKMKYVLASGFAKVAAWVIFAVCTILMITNKKNKKKKLEDK